jgi:hypothetical protein
MSDFASHVHAMFREIVTSYADGMYILNRDTLDQFGVPKDGRNVLPLREALFNPKDDKTKSVLYLLAASSNADMKYENDLVSEVYVFNPSDVFFWANMSREYSVAEKNRPLSRSDCDLTWKFIRFKLRNFSGVGRIKDTLVDAGMGDALQDGQASFTLNMTRASGRERFAFAKFSETFGPALVTRSFRESYDVFSSAR